MFGYATGMTGVTYYDTPDLRLGMAGVEVWEMGDWHAEFPADRERREVVGPVAAPAGAVPPELRNLVAAYTAGRELVECVHVRVRSEEPLPDKGSSVADVLTADLRGQIDALRAADVRLRLDKPDALHDVRVAARRLRSSLRVYRRYFDAEHTRFVRGELGWWSRLLGDARDNEVLRERIAEPIRELPPELVLGPVWSEMDRMLAHPETEASQAWRNELGGPRYLALFDALERLRGAPPFRGRARRQAAKALPRQIAKAYRKTHAAVTTAQHASPGTERDTALHNVRKKAKRLRYACEAAEPAVGKRARKLARSSKRIQRTLGDHHDAVVVRPVLRQLGANAYLDGANGFTFGVVHGLLDERAAGQEAVFERRWRHLVDSAARRKLTRR